MLACLKDSPGNKSIILVSCADLNFIAGSGVGIRINMLLVELEFLLSTSRLYVGCIPLFTLERYVLVS